MQGFSISALFANWPRPKQMPHSAALPPAATFHWDDHFKHLNRSRDKLSGHRTKVVPTEEQLSRFPRTIRGSSPRELFYRVLCAVAAAEGSLNRSDILPLLYSTNSNVIEYIAVSTSIEISLTNDNGEPIKPLFDSVEAVPDSDWDYVMLDLPGRLYRVSASVDRHCKLKQIFTMLCEVGICPRLVQFNGIPEIGDRKTLKEARGSVPCLCGTEKEIQRIEAGIASTLTIGSGFYSKKTKNKKPPEISSVERCLRRLLVLEDLLPVIVMNDNWNTEKLSWIEQLEKSQSVNDVARSLRVLEQNVVAESNSRLSDAPSMILSDAGELETNQMTLVWSSLETQVRWRDRLNTLLSSEMVVSDDEADRQKRMIDDLEYLLDHFAGDVVSSVLKKLDKIHQIPRPLKYSKKTMMSGYDSGQKPRKVPVENPGRSGVKVRVDPDNLITGTRLENDLVITDIDLPTPPSKRRQLDGGVAVIRDLSYTPDMKLGYANPSVPFVEAPLSMDLDSFCRVCVSIFGMKTIDVTVSDFQFMYIRNRVYIDVDTAGFTMLEDLVRYLKGKKLYFTLSSKQK